MLSHRKAVKCILHAAAAAAAAAAGSMQVLVEAFLQQPAAVAAALEVAHRSNPLLQLNMTIR
jgi:hypothetical protein